LDDADLEQLHEQNKHNVENIYNSIINDSNNHEDDLQHDNYTHNTQQQHTISTNNPLINYDDDAYEDTSNINN